MERDSTILMNDLRQHQPAACQQLLTEYGPAVFRMVQRIVTRREDAEEVYQDVFVKALRGIEGYDSRQASLATWLNRIAYHESLNFVRGKKPNIVYMDDRDPRAGHREHVLLRQSEPRRHCIRHWLHSLYRRLAVEPYPQETLPNH